MRKEENVGLEGTQTEEVAAAKEERALAVLGKFKDIDALSRAYEALEAEFTRRSQKLRSLEREVENLQAQSLSSGAEKLRKTAKARREAAREFDSFLADVDKTVAVRKPTEISAQDSSLLFMEEGGGETSTKEGKEVLATKESGEATMRETVEGEENPKADGENVAEGAIALENRGQAMDLETLYRLALENEDVRLRIIGEYLTSLGKSGAPLTGGTAGVITAPPKKAKTVGQAGAMALSYFQKPIVG